MWSKGAYFGAHPDGRSAAAAEQLRSCERHPTRAKSRDAFLEKGSRMNGIASESLSYGGGGGGSHACPAADRSGHGAKRARVENIVRGMIGSPVGEMKRDPEQRPQVSEKRFLTATLPEERQPTPNCSSDTTRRDGPSSGKSESISGGRSPGGHKWTHLSLTAGVLKYQVTGAVTSTSLESMFQSLPLREGRWQKASAESSPNAHQQSSGGHEVRVPGVQTEALSLVVPRRGADGFHRSPSGVETEPERTRDAIRRHGNGGASEFESGQAKVPSRVRSGSRRSPATRVTAAESTPLASVCFPRVKMEPRGLLHRHLYGLNEALSAEHLKKAKLMFFYTRYPSWRLLRLCFRDVQFTRRGASRLIKWFSNFREFYYIQVERFARRALAEGAADAGASPSVGRESQLFRVLKAHYDKGGRFQVPNGFLEVAELTLRQFYTAVSTGKDRDPSWKKAIYKVICKLDAELPAQFIPCGPGGPADDLTSGQPQRRRWLTRAF